MLALRITAVQRAISDVISALEFVRRVAHGLAALLRNLGGGGGLVHRLVDRRGEPVQDRTGGVRAGAWIPNHAMVSTAANPASRTVGTIGREGERLGLVTASARNRPSLIWPKEKEDCPSRSPHGQRSRRSTSVQRRGRAHGSCPSGCRPSGLLRSDGGWCRCRGSVGESARVAFGPREQTLPACVTVRMRARRTLGTFAMLETAAKSSGL